MRRDSLVEGSLRAGDGTNLCAATAAGDRRKDMQLRFRSVRCSPQGISACTSLKDRKELDEQGELSGFDDAIRGDFVIGPRVELDLRFPNGEAVKAP